MAEQTIRCPSCNVEIPLTEALSLQIRESVRGEFASRERERDALLKKREEELAKKLGGYEEDFAKRLSVERTRLAGEAEKKAGEEFSLKVKSLEERNAEKDKLLEASRSAELELLKQKAALEEQKRGLDLELARKFNAGAEQIRQKALDAYAEEHKYKDLEKDKQMSDMRKTIDELKRKSEQGSMQTQGEVLELELEKMLRERFPVDVIEPVAKGRKGADIIHKVYTRTGAHCGSIAWEMKRTRAWSDDWLVKLKDDQREAKAELAVLVTETMPKSVSAFAQMEGVWVVSITHAADLASVLRIGLIELAQSKTSMVGRGEKMEAVYNYLSGTEFRHKIEAIVGSFRIMKKDLEHEKIAYAKMWAKREKQIERVTMNTIKMYGDLEGIIGAGLPEIKTLELTSGDDDTGELI